MKSAKAWLIAWGAGFIFAAAAHGALAEDLVPFACQFDSLVQGWQGQVSCYHLSVPENRADANSRTINLTVYEINSRSETPAPPVVYLAGGPGVGAAYYVNILLRHPLRQDRPIVILEQRGIGGSGELCPLLRRNYYRRVATRRDNDLRRRQFIGLVLNCFKDERDAGTDIDAYTTEENAHDVAVLRTALGLGKMDIWAVSYGTVLAQAYMRLEPDHLGAVVFDASVPSDYELERNLTANFRHVLDTQWAACVADGTCDASDQDFNARLDAIIPDYDARPLRMLGFSPEPSIVVTSVYVTGVDAAGIVFSLLYEQPSYDEINRVLVLLERRSASFLRAHYQRLAIPGFSFGMHYAINCREPAASEEELVALRNQDPVLFDAMQVGLQHELCANSELSPPEDGANEPVQYPGRMLVMTGALDPITPMSVTAPLRDRFPNAGFLEVRGGGHGPSRTLGCAAETVRRYFADPDGPVYDFCGIGSGP